MNRSQGFYNPPMYDSLSGLGKTIGILAMRCVGGSYHGCTIQANPSMPIHYERYHLAVLERQTPTLLIRERVWLLSSLSPDSRETQDRWMDLRLP